MSDDARDFFIGTLFLLAVLCLVLGIPYCIYRLLTADSLVDVFRFGIILLVVAVGADAVRVRWP